LKVVLCLHFSLLLSPHNSRGRPVLAFNEFAAAAAGTDDLTTDAIGGTSEKSVLMQRDFCFVPYGASFPIIDSQTRHRNRPIISCDGRVSITAPRSDSDNNSNEGPPHLELSHWTNHQTPKELYADTSTEIALNFVKLRQQQRLQQHQQQVKNSDTEPTKQQQQQLAYYAHFDSAWVLNSHYDTDGVLSVWACLQQQQPDMLDRYAHLLVQAAEAGDFREWSSDNGVKLDCALSALLNEFSDNEETAYHAALEQLPDMLHDFEITGGLSYEHLWRKNGSHSGWEQALSGWQDIQEGRVKLKRFEDSRLVLVYEKQQPLQQQEEEDSHQLLLSPYALHRGLREAAIRLVFCASCNSQCRPPTRRTRSEITTIRINTKRLAMVGCKMW
jgi:hypothetical protein